jgi:hypothetical protein
MNPWGGSRCGGRACWRVPWWIISWWVRAEYIKLVSYIRSISSAHHALPIKFTHLIVSAINLLVAFCDIHGRKGEVLFFYLPEIDCDRIAMSLPPDTSALFRGKAWASRRHIWDASATPSGIKRERYVCIYKKKHINMYLSRIHSTSLISAYYWLSKDECECLEYLIQNRKLEIKSFLSYIF